MMILDLVVLVLGATLTLVALRVEIEELLGTFLDVFVGESASKMTVHEDKRCVLDAKSDHNSTFFT